jgi:hypothetical protein
MLYHLGEITVLAREVDTRVPWYTTINATNSNLNTSMILGISFISLKCHADQARTILLLFVSMEALKYAHFANL